MCHQNRQNGPVRINKPGAALRKADDPKENINIEKEKKVEEGDGME